MWGNSVSYRHLSASPPCRPGSQQATTLGQGQAWEWGQCWAVGWGVGGQCRAAEGYGGSPGVPRRLLWAHGLTCWMCGVVWVRSI